MTIALKHPQRYRSVSAFAPICAPSQCPWGHKAFGAYLGSDQTTWQSYDSVALLKQASRHVPMLVDQGAADEFLEEQLKPHLLQQAAQQTAYPLTLRQHEGYDHSYFFIASFMQQHLEFHAQHLV